MEHGQVVGTWKLVSFEIRHVDGTIEYPYTHDAIGRLMYDEAGHMAVQLGSVHRPGFAAGDPLNAMPQEAKAAIDSYTAYFGSYEVDHEQGVVSHRIAGSVFPNWSGTVQHRYFVFVGDHLVLRTPPYLLGGVQATSHLIWERE